MVKGYSPLDGSPEEVSRRLLRKIEALEKSQKADSDRVKALEDLDIDARLTALENQEATQQEPEGS